MEKFINLKGLQTLWKKIQETFIARVVGDYVILTRDGNQLTGDTPGAGDGTIIIQYADGPRIMLTGKKGTSAGKR